MRKKTLLEVGPRSFLSPCLGLRLDFQNDEESRPRTANPKKTRHY